MRPGDPLPVRWPRRSVLVLGLGALATGLVSGSARAAAVGVGELLVDVPADIGPAGSDARLGQGWQYVGQTNGATLLPTEMVLARADLASVDAGEILGLLLAGSGSGLLADLEVEVLRTRPMSAGEQARIDITYAAQPGLTYHGTLLIATRETPPAAAVAVVGDNTLTAGMIDDVLSTVRWRS